MESAQDYYRGEGPLSEAGAQAGDLRGLPGGIAAACKVVQGVLIHRDMAPFAYNLQLNEADRDNGHLRSIAAMLKRIREIENQPLTKERALPRRLPCVCRHYSLLLVALLRQQGIPARARCGFGAYFNAGKFEDHWVGEYWNDKQSRWIMVDAQMDEVQRRLFKLDFDPLDVPRNRFIIAGDAWQMCRSGRAKPDAFGLSHAHLQGLWFIAGNVVRDLASLNRMELLPWDAWGIMPMPDAPISDDTLVFIDKVAALTIAGDDAFPQVRAIYDDDRLRVPPIVFNVLRNAQEQVAGS